MINASIYAIIVAYKPVAEMLLATCNTLESQGVHIVVVDNTEETYIDKRIFSERCFFIDVGYNSGIAYAQNLGVKYAIAQRAEIIIFFDQDSVISPGFIAALLATVDVNQPQIVSPLCIDNISQQEVPALKVSSLGLPHPVYRNGREDSYPVDVVISSGMAVTCKVFEVVGQFDADMFIDLVDTEWCLRCRAKNIPIKVVPSAIMPHRIGSSPIRLGVFTILVHSPIRCYYQLRNSIYLFRKQHVPLLFSIRELLATIFSRFLLLLFVKNKVAYIKSYLCGIRDGLCGITGCK